MARAYMSIYRTGGEVLLAACDEELLGKKFREGRVVLDVSKEFYGSMLVELDELAAYMEQATVMNLVGEKVVRLAIEKGHVHEDSVMRVSNVPHAQVVVIRW